jgi:DNA-binding IclR family transcriptional regulator
MGLFTPEKAEWTVEAASRELGVSVSTAYRYFRSLCKIGFLDPFAEGRYMLGPALIEYDRQIRMIDPLIKVGRPVMQRLVGQTGSLGIVILCRVYRDCIMCVHQEAHVLAENTVSYERGRPMPIFLGAGKVILANLPSRMARMHFHRHTGDVTAAGLGTDWETVKANLRQIRRAGVVIARGEIDSDRVGVAVPIFNSKMAVLGSVSMALPQKEATPQFLASVSVMVQAAGREISVGLAVLSSRDFSQEGAVLPESHKIAPLSPRL